MASRCGLLVAILGASLVLLFVQAQDPANKCTGNTTYTECGSTCIPTCNNKGEFEMCALACFVGCECKPGYVRRNEKDENSCILLKDCPSS